MKDEPAAAKEGVGLIPSAKVIPQQIYHKGSPDSEKSLRAFTSFYGVFLNSSMKSLTVSSRE